MLADLKERAMDSMRQNTPLRSVLSLAGLTDSLRILPYAKKRIFREAFLAEPMRHDTHRERVMSLHSANRPFAGSADGDAAAILPSMSTHMATQEAAIQPATFYPAGSEIYAQGDKSGSLYQVDFGCVRICRLLMDGRRQISEFHLSGEVFGFEAGERHHFFAEAVGATGVRTLRLRAGGEDLHAILPLTLQSLTRAQEHLLVLGRQNAAERIAAFLLDMAERQGGLDRFDLPMPRSDIADYLGLTIETVSRVFSKMKQNGIIHLLGPRRVAIANKQALRDMNE